MEFTERTFEGTYLSGKGNAIHRRVDFEESGIRVTDWSEKQTVTSSLPVLPFVSWGYGRKVLNTENFPF